jgi:hypothetical protein
VAAAFPEKQLLGILWQIKKQCSCWTFALMGRKMALSKGKSTTVKAIFLLIKAMQILPI